MVGFWTTSQAHHFAALGFSATEVWMSQSVAKNRREDSATGHRCYPCFPQSVFVDVLVVKKLGQKMSL